MISNEIGAMFYTSSKYTSAADNVTIHGHVSDHMHTAERNTSLRDDCIKVIFSEMEFLPWDNPDNIVTAEVEATVRRIKNNMLGLLFLIGGPANVINMAVFYKQGLKDRVNLCLFVLSLTDGLYLTMAMAFHGEQLHIQFTTKEAFGPVVTILTNLNLTLFLTPFGYISYVLSTIIATERCLCVFNPLKFQSLLRTRTMAVTIIAVFTLVLGLFFIVTFRYRLGCVYNAVSGVEITTGIEGEFYKAHKELIDNIESYVFGFGLPGLVMIVVTVTTIMTTVKLRQTVKWRFETTSSISAREVALTKMLIGNSAFFISCTFPKAMNRSIWIFFPEANIGRRNQNIFLAGLWTGETFAYLNSTFNIVIYFIMGSHYRETLRALFRKKSASKTLEGQRTVTAVTT